MLIRRYPTFAPASPPPMHAYALNGEIERAVMELAEARNLSGDDRYSSIARLRGATEASGVSEFKILNEATYFAGLRKAGVPEE
jgi:hypothetical protein